jgi:MoxR-like ATPase
MSLPEAGETIHAGRGGLGAPQPILFGSAYNPRYQGVVRLNEALNNRFAIQLEWDYDHDVEAQLLKSSTLLDMAEHIRSIAEIRTPVSTNALMEFERHAMLMGSEFAETLFLNRFPPEDRGSVFRALEGNSATIADELGLVAA